MIATKIFVEQIYRDRVQRAFFACSNCETEIRNEDQFCRMCGYEFKTTMVKQVEQLR